VADQNAAGIRQESVEGWLAGNIEGLVPPFVFELIAGGESNYTFRVTDAAGQRCVLRRPPEGELLATAHDVLREARLMRGLWDTGVPVPAVLGVCDDLDVTGAPFYVMRYVDGFVLRTVDEMDDAFPVDRRAEACRRLLDALVAIHEVDLDATGLGGLAKRDGYVERQLRRWRVQWEAAGSPHAPAMAEIHDDLVASLPRSTSGPGTLVHGDFRFDNAVVGADGAVRAVLDWELATLGDPLADLAITVAAWSAPGEAMSFGAEGPTSAEGCLDRAEAVAYYGAASGRDVSQLAWYVAWAHWRIACILSGVYARNTGGGGRGTHSAEAYYAELVHRADQARRALDDALQKQPVARVRPDE
jgi:aminoglycoside phosphotransferase (APT) family kinase protein